MKPPLRSGPPKRTRPGGFFLIFLRSFGIILFVRAALAAPIATHFDASTTPLRGPVWAFAQADDGTLFCGSNTLVRFDGARWSTVPMPAAAYAFRALAHSPARDGKIERIWVGALNALGYLEHQNDPSAPEPWRFTPLPRPGPIGDVWQVFTTADGAAFLTSDRVLVWHDTAPAFAAAPQGRFEIHDLPNNAHLLGYTSSESPGTIWIYQPGTGLLRLSANATPTLAAPESALPHQPVTWFAPPLIGLGDAAYRWDGQACFDPLPDLSARLHDSLPAGATRLGDGSLVIGTFKRGLIRCDADGHPIETIRARDGLGGDNVNTLAITNRGLLVGLEAGFSRLVMPERAGWLPNTPDRETGNLHRVIAFGHRSFLLTPHGLYPLNGDAVGAPLLGGEALLRDAAVIGGRLWIAGFGGLWSIDPDERVGHEHQVWADVLQVTGRRGHPGEIVFTEGYALKLLQPSEHGGWATHELGFTLTDTPTGLVETADGDLWVSTFTAGIFRLRWIDDRRRAHPRLALEAHYRSGQGLPADAIRVSHIGTVGDRLVAFTEPSSATEDGSGQGAILVLHDESNTSTFGPATSAEGFSGLASADGARESFWVVRRHPLDTHAVVRVTEVEGQDPPLEIQPVDTPALDRLGAIDGCQLVETAAGRRLWITGSEGILYLDLASSTAPTIDPSDYRLILRSATRGQTPAWHYAAPIAADGTPLFFQTRLEGVESGWSAPTRDSTRAFTGLASGAYTFKVRAVDRWGRSGPEISAAFTIPSPWWRSKYSVLGYILAATIIVVGLTRWRIGALRRQNERLNRLVEARTAELAERTRQLDLSNAAKGEFLASISHEIRNPLNGMVGLVTMLNEEVPEGRVAQLARSMAACAKTLARVFEEVLDFSKLEQGPVAVRTRAFRLDALVEEVVGVFRAEAEQRGCALDLRLPPLPHRHLGDDEKLRTILSNLVGNALKYAPGAPIDITVTIDPAEEETAPDWVTIAVVDHGPGVPKEEQELIFKKFVRGRGAKEGQVPGAGLGLAASTALVGLLGGHLELESSNGRGATFLFTVPLAPTTHETREATSKPVPIRRPGESGLALIVDDQDYNRLVAGRVAERLGYSPTLAAHAEAALKHFATQACRLVLLDWEMPGMKGGELARRLRDLPGGAEAIIIATTAHDSETIREGCRTAGMNGFLLKPFGEQGLSRLLERLEDEAFAIGGSESLQPLAMFEQLGDIRSGGAQAAAIAYGEALEMEISAVTAAIDCGDRSAIRAAAHRLRSHAALASLAGLQAVARALEDQAGHAGEPRWDAWTGRLAAAAAEARATLAAYNTATD